MTVSPGSTITAHFATLPDPHVPGLYTDTGGGDSL
jgi:hypothetical protein